MTTDNATPKRKPAGAAVAGAHPRPKLYPRQAIAMLSDETADYIERASRELNLSKSEVIRTLIEAGIEAGESAARADD